MVWCIMYILPEHKYNINVGIGISVWRAQWTLKHYMTVNWKENYGSCKRNYLNIDRAKLFYIKTVLNGFRRLTAA